MLRRAASGIPLILIGGLLSAASTLPYRDGPPPAHTGGFGEPTCHECHFDAPLDDPRGTLGVPGLPERYEPGTRYRLRIALSQPGMRRAGFQAAFRYASGARAGAPAGELVATGDSVQITHSDSTGVPYAQHTAKGSVLQTPGMARWTLEWRAPDPAAGAIVIHVAANAANDDASEFGDFIHTFEAELRPKD